MLSGQARRNGNSATQGQQLVALRTARSTARHSSLLDRSTWLYWRWLGEPATRSPMCSVARRVTTGPFPILCIGGRTVARLPRYLASVIMAAPTVPPVASSMRIKPPVSRFR